jgi:2-keto-4-pentenoate hydratase
MASETPPPARKDPESRFSDPLAAALWQARERAVPLRREDWPEVSGQRGAAVAAELYGAMRDAGAALLGAKLGVTDEQAQRKLGADGPMVAPVYDATELQDDETIALGGLVEPKLEAEFGLRIERGELRAVPCIEVIDSRWTGAVAIGHVLADFGWQAGMMFGPPLAPPAEIEVVVRHDGSELSRGRRSLEQAVPAVDRARRAIEGFEELATAFVATGTILAALPLSPGRWSVDFGPLGTLELGVEA